MSKLQWKVFSAQLLIWGSMFSGVWLYADFLTHHWMRGTGTQQFSGYAWMNNPFYHLNAYWLVSTIFAFVAGLIISYECRKQGFQWRKSKDSSEIYGLLGAIFVTIAFGVSFFVAYEWYSERNFGSYTGPLGHWAPYWTWSMWWCLLVGWSTVAAMFCVFQYRRTLPRQSAISYISSDSEFSGVSTEDLTKMEDIVLHEADLKISRIRAELERRGVEVAKEQALLSQPVVGQSRRDATYLHLVDS